MDPKYPDITVELVGTDGNAFAVLGNVWSLATRLAMSDALSWSACRCRSRPSW
jgi:hypothetical protein